MKNKKVLLAGTLFAIISVGMTLSAPEARAASNWKNYFSNEEAKSMKKMVANYVRDQIEENKASWKGIISGKNIKKNSITADNLKDGVMDVEVEDGAIDNAKLADSAVTASKIAEGAITADVVDETVAKRTIYTGTIECDESAADEVVDVGSSHDLYKVIDAPEIEMSKSPVVNLFYRVPAAWTVNQVAEDLWTTPDYNYLYFHEGEIVLLYGHSFENEDPTTCVYTDYNLTVSY
jgi:hypothetical protein